MRDVYLCYCIIVSCIQHGSSHLDINCYLELDRGRDAECPARPWSSGSVVTLPVSVTSNNYTIICDMFLIIVLLTSASAIKCNFGSFIHKQRWTMSTSAQNCIIMATLQNIAVLQCATPLQCQCKVQYQYFTHFHFTLTSVIILLAPHWIVKCLNFSNSTCFITRRFKWFWIKLVLRHQRYYSIIEWLLTFESLIDLILWDYDDCNAEKPSDPSPTPTHS